MKKRKVSSLGFFVLLKRQLKAGDLWAVNEPTSTPAVSYISWQMEYIESIHTSAALHWAELRDCCVVSVYSVLCILLKYANKIHLLKCKTSTFWLCPGRNSFSISQWEFCRSLRGCFSVKYAFLESPSELSRRQNPRNTWKPTERTFFFCRSWKWLLLFAHQLSKYFQAWKKKNQRFGKTSFTYLFKDLFPAPAAFQSCFSFADF